MDALRHWNGQMVKLTPITDLHLWGDNPRDHDDEDVTALAHSIEMFGWTEPVLVQASTNRVVAGHGRLMAAQRLGMGEVPVAFLEMDDMEADAYAIADNQLATLSKWNPVKLKTVLQGLAEQDTTYLNAIGFRPEEMSALLDRSAEFLQQFESQPTEEEPGRVVGEGREEMIPLSVPLTITQHRTIIKAIRTKKQESGMVAGEALAAICFSYLERNPT